MTSTKKKGGLGAESYFENIPTLDPVVEKESLEAEVEEKPAEEEVVAGFVEVVADGKVPDLILEAVEEAPAAELEVVETDLETEDADEEGEPPQRQKIRRTYALYEETQIALEEMKLAARKQGVKMTLGDLLEEAVQLLMEKKGMVRDSKSPDY